MNVQAVRGVVNAAANATKAARPVATGNALLAELQALARPAPGGGGNWAAQMAEEVASSGADAARGGAKLSGNVKEIAKAFGVSRGAVNDAIHAVKNEGKFGGARRNGDVMVDIRSGETYLIKGNGGTATDAIGNVLDFLDR